MNKTIISFLTACFLLISSISAIGFSTHNTTIARSFDKEEAVAGESIMVTVSFTNLEVNELRGFYYTEYIPDGLSVSTENVKIDASDVTNYVFEIGQVGNVYAGYVPFRWILETPSDFSENNTINQSATLKIVYRITSSQAGTFSLDEFCWAGYYQDAAAGEKAAFGHSEDADKQTITFTANPELPVANFSGTPTTGTAPLEVSFTDSTTGDIDSRSWTFGDGGSSTAQNPTYIYDDHGAYTVSLTVTGPGGSDTETKSGYITVIEAPEPPVANFSGTPTTGMSPLLVSFTDSSAGDIDTWSWDFGDSGTSTAQNPTYTYDDAGTYTVSLTVTSPSGSDTETKNNYITVTVTPPEYILTVNIVGSGSVTLNPPGGNYDAGTVVQLTAVPGGGGGTEGMFTGWSGGLSGSDNPETITIDSDKTITATFIEIGVESGDLTSMNCVDPGSIEDSPDKPDDFPYGLIEMEIEVINAGDQAIITIYLPKVAPADYKWYKYTSTGEWVDFDRNVISNGSGDGAVFNTDRTEVALYITDNGQYDDDPAVMIIRDPSGIGFLAASGGAGSSSSGGGGCFISTAASGPAM